MSHYFKDDPNLKSEIREIDFLLFNRAFSFSSDAGVFSKNELDEGTKTLLECTIRQNLSGRVLDLGCGIGMVGVVLGVLYPELTVDLTDVNHRALNLASINKEHYHLENLNVFYSDGFQQIQTKYNFVVTNPPIRAGKMVVYSFFDGSYEHLVEGGILLVVIRKSHGAPSAKQKLEELFGNCEIIDRNKGYYVLKSVKN